MTGRKLNCSIALILLIISFVSIFTQSTVLAEEAQFKLDADSLSIKTGVSTNLVITMVNAQSAEVAEVRGLENFDVISSSESTSTQIVNGNVTKQKAIYFVLMPKKAGQFTLQASIEYNGNTYQTNELKINVSESSSETGGEIEDLFIKTLLSDNEIYFGQKVALSYELYSRYSIENYGFLDSINIDGFILNEVPQDELKGSYVYLGDKKYIKYEARQMYLTPIKTGAFTIPSYNFQVNVSTGNFFNSSKPFYFQTDFMELNVKPLPLENQPEDFSGIVGKLDLESSYSRNEIDYGDSLTLRVTAWGECNLEALNKIIKDGLPGFAVYESEKSIQESIEDNKYKARKEFEVILVPETNGDIKIDPIYISYFDPESGSYKQAEIPGTTITVNGEIPQFRDQAHNGTPSLETVRIDQVSYNLQDEAYLTIQLEKDIIVIVLAVFLALLVLAAVFFLMLVYRRRRNNRLFDIYKRLKKSDDRNEIYNLLNDMIKQCFKFSLKASTRSSIMDRLSVYQLADPVQDIMDYLENKKADSDKGNVYLKSRIKVIYKKLKKVEG